MYSISIPKPCFVGWENMQPNERGRYCNACAKTVIDFSVMNDEEVQQYFIINHGKEICGHFKNDQLQRIRIDLPENIFRTQLVSWKKFLVALLVIYGAQFLSIDTTLASTPLHANTDYKNEWKTPGVTKEKKKHKKQLRKKYKKYIIGDLHLIDSFPVLTTAGFTQTDPLPEDDRFCAPGKGNPIKQAHKNDTIYRTATGNDLTSNKTEPGSVPNPIPEKLSFIVPPIIILRRALQRKNKQPES